METIQATSENQATEKNKLLRILGVGFGLAVVIGGTIGVGILRTPGEIVALLGSVQLVILVWILGGVYTFFSANYTAELATMLPAAGGPYVYARRAFGDYGGFVIGWSDWLGNTAATAFLSIAFAEYLIELVPFSIGVSGVAVAIVLLLAVLNWKGSQMGSDAQKLMSLLKTIALLAFVVVCFAFGGGQQTNAAQTETAPITFYAQFVAVVLGFQLVLGTYGGWNTVIYFAEEDENPAQNIPRSLMGGVLLVVAIYLLINLALLYVLPIPQLAVSKLAAADAMQQIFGARSGQIVTLLAMLSLIAIVNVCILQTPRTLYALGRDGLFSAKACAVNKGGTPTVSLIVSVLMAILLVLSGTFETLLAIYAFFGVAMNVLLIIALFVLRRREPDLPRPFKTWGYPLVPFILLLISILLFIGFIISDVSNSLYALILIAASYPIFWLIKRQMNLSRES
jgi:APA family basic amino acid/polyamine antiporter